MKRIFDITVIMLGMPLLLPVLVVVALLVRIKLGSPILFRQARPGLGCRPFMMYKFRSMTNQMDAQGRLLPDAERLPPFGKFLRSTSLDELPELWNVLTGDMSLVGPRPLLIEYLPLYSPQQIRRHDVMPGITGLAQVSGRNALSWGEKFALDLWYAENQSVWLDIKILILTLRKIVARSGISAEGEATMPKFTGNK